MSLFIFQNIYISDRKKNLVMRPTSIDS